MDTKDHRGYVNPYVPGGLTPETQQSGMIGEVYIEDRKGKQIDALLRSVREGTVVQVPELFYLAPGLGRPQTRRRILSERIEAIKANGGRLLETQIIGPPRRLPSMLMRAYEQIATSGRARKHNRPGRQPKWVFTKVELEIMKGLWCSRGLQNDAHRTYAIQQRIGKPITRAWLRRAFGSPHGR